MGTPDLLLLGGGRQHRHPDLREQDRGGGRPRRQGGGRHGTGPGVRAARCRGGQEEDGLDGPQPGFEQVALHLPPDHREQAQGGKRRGRRGEGGSTTATRSSRPSRPPPSPPRGEGDRSGYRPCPSSTWRGSESVKDTGSPRGGGRRRGSTSTNPSSPWDTSSTS